MTEDLIVGLVAGVGWGLFIGGILGSLWFTYLISGAESEDDVDGPGTDG